jgi:hypothetical protein
MNEVIHRHIPLRTPNVYERAKWCTVYVRAAAQIMLASAALIIVTAISTRVVACAQGTPEAAPQSGATVTQEGTVTAPGAIVRTPEDIQKDRDIVPQGEAPREVPNPPTIPSDQYWKLKQRSGESTPGNEQDSPARK